MFGQQQKLQLALPSSKLPLVYRHPLQSLVTSLPYVDEEISDQKTRMQVERLIQNEMQNMEPVDYLADLPLPQTQYTELIQNEMNRVSNEIPMEKTNFEGKYIIESQPQSEQEMKSAIDLLSVREQHNQIAHMNFELLNKFGADFYKLLIIQQQAEKERLGKQLDKVKHETNEINALRKYEQLETKQKIDQFKHRVADLRISNDALELECLNLEEEVKQIQRKKMKLID